MHLLAGLLGLSLICGVVFAQDASDKVATGLGKLTKPWSELSSLTSEQRDKIRLIHGKAVEEVKTIRAKEEADIMALLTDEQKSELKVMEEKAKADGKARRASSKEKPADEEGDKEK
jgi:Spy/CpxP family protein refolding chaperone